jgi:uncharacterized protein YjiS (DUF1127 family)
MVVIALVKRVYDEAVRLLNRQKTRRQLLTLDKHALKDIGLTRSEALHEGAKSLWND